MTDHTMTATNYTFGRYASCPRMSVMRCLSGQVEQRHRGSGDFTF